MATNSLYPQIDYGQKKGAWNPGTRDPVYQQVNRARTDLDFGRGMATDILLGQQKGYYVDRASPVSTWTGTGYKWVAGRTWEEFQKAGQGVQHSMNPYKSWVPQAFGGGYMKDESGQWYSVNLKRSGSGLNFRQGGKVSNENILNQLNSGTYAFKTAGADGKEVYMTWADGYVPKKSGGQKPEEGNAKQTRSSGVQREVVGVNQAKPGNVMGGAIATLLGGADETLKNKTLLGGSAS